MAQQTAVEWLAEKYNYVTWMRNRDEILPGMADEWRKHYLDQAKQMEKEQIIDAKDCWFEDERDGEQYYNETFGNQITDDTTSPNTKNK